MTKLAPEWVRTSDPVIRSPARYRWITAPAPKGSQQGIHGPVVCVAADIKKTVERLPRPIDDSGLMKVKLKRKLAYRGHTPAGPHQPSSG